MRKIKQIIRLNTQGYSKLKISRRLDVSRRIVRTYIRRFQKLQITYEDITGLIDAELDKLLLKQSIQEVPLRLKRLRSFFPYVNKELKKTGVTRYRLWQEYTKKYPDGYQLSQFCEHYRRWNRETGPLMHIEHKAGDKMYIDYAGKKLHLVDAQTGEVSDVEVYVAILGAIQLTYVQATLTQNKEDLSPPRKTPCTTLEVRRRPSYRII